MKIDWFQRKSVFGDEWFEGTCGKFRIELGSDKDDTGEIYQWTWTLYVDETDQEVDSYDNHPECETRAQAEAQIKQAIEAAG